MTVMKGVQDRDKGNVLRTTAVKGIQRKARERREDECELAKGSMTRGEGSKIVNGIACNLMGVIERGTGNRGTIPGRLTMEGEEGVASLWSFLATLGSNTI